MKRTATVVCIREAGVPEQAARVEQWELPELQPHDVLIEPQAAPINPADLNMLEGTYGTQPALPAVAGMEGVGVVAETGAAVTSLRVGQPVIAPVQRGWWCSARVLGAANVFAIPAAIARDTAAMLTVNPPTAYRMLADFVALRPGDWILQNAANSAVGRFVIQLAKANGWRTINVVRRPELIAELQAIGADVVVTDQTPLRHEISQLTGGAAVRLALNAVGGDSARALAQSLAPHGTLVTYGAMARQPVRIDNGLLIFHDLRVRGFWISEWYRNATRLEIDQMFAALLPLATCGQLTTPVEQTYKLQEAPIAIAHAKQSGRGGKILFVPVKK